MSYEIFNGAMEQIMKRDSKNNFKRLICYIDVSGKEKKGRLVHCYICGKRIEGTMTYTAIRTKYFKNTCKSNKSAIYFRDNLIFHNFSKFIPNYYHSSFSYWYYGKLKRMSW